jgi:hypothetical protein
MPSCSGGPSRWISESAIGGDRLNRTCCCRSSFPRTVWGALTRRHRRRRPNPRSPRSPNHRVPGSRVRRLFSSRRWISSGFGARPCVRAKAWLKQTLWRVDPAPPPEAPRQIPSRARWSGQRHVVDPRRAPRLAAQQPRQGHPSAGPQPKALDRLVAIDRAGRQVTAVVSDKRRQRVPVKPDHRAPRIARNSQNRAGTVRTMRVFHRRRARC